MDFKPDDFEVDSKIILDEELEKQERILAETIYVPWEFLMDVRLSHGAIRLFLILKKYARMDNNGKRAFPTRKRLAKIMGVSSRQIDTLKNQLKEAGYVSWTPEPGKTEGKPWHNVYILRNAVSMGEENFPSGRKLPTTNRVVGLTPTPTPMATGAGVSPKKKKITKKKFIELADKEIPDWRVHYQLSYEEGSWYYYGLSQVFDDWLYKNQKDYQNDFDSLKSYPWERKLELLTEFLTLK